LEFDTDTFVENLVCNSQKQPCLLAVLLVHVHASLEEEAAF